MTFSGAFDCCYQFGQLREACGAWENSGGRGELYFLIGGFRRSSNFFECQSEYLGFYRARKKVVFLSRPSVKYVLRKKQDIKTLVLFIN